jgi:hypothetical protein
MLKGIQYNKATCDAHYKVIGLHEESYVSCDFLK